MWSSLTFRQLKSGFTLNMYVTKKTHTQRTIQMCSHKIDQLGSLTKWFRVRLQIKKFRVRIFPKKTGSLLGLSTYRSFTNLRYILLFCAIWYHLYNLKNVKNTHGGVIILVKLQASTHHLYIYLCVPLADNYFSNVKYVTSMLHFVFAKDTLWRYSL